MYTSVREVGISVRKRVGVEEKEADKERGREKRLNKKDTRRY
jgi:hypothetical protein